MDRHHPPVLDWRCEWLAAAEADNLRRVLADEVDWETKHSTLFGRHPLPRLTRWYGPGVYRYSGTTNRPTDWTAELPAICRQVSYECDVEFNACLLNLYRSGSDTVGWHADDEPELGNPASSTVATLVLGARRAFQLRDDESGQTISIEPGHGDLVILRPPCQATHSHRVPRRRNVTDEHISLTFRRWMSGG